MPNLALGKNVTAMENKVAAMLEKKCGLMTNAEILSFRLAAVVIWA
tara:strand:+ start:17348 stop:17485 length:138 start_codon:yes stop_codon:yes gene_type:complete